MLQEQSLHKAKETTGFIAIDQEVWHTSVAVFEHFDTCMEVFLERWATRMEHSGYLSFTTARRDDCIASCHALLDPLRNHRDQNMLPTFESLRDNADGWADVLLASGMRHWQRGITGEMFLGCFKVFVAAIEDALQTLPKHCPQVASSALPHAVNLLHIYASAFEVIWMKTCLQRLPQKQYHGQDEVFRLLTLEKCRFENVFNATSDGVLIMDASCRISIANRSLRQYAGEALEGKAIWEVLDLEGSTPEEFFCYYHIGQTVEVSPFGNDLVFRLSIASLGGISLASTGDYLVLLTNITPQVFQRESLEKAIQHYTGELLNEKRQLEEMNITLRNVLQHVHQEQDRQREALSDSIRRFLVPALQQLSSERDDTARKATLAIIQDQMQRFLSGGTPAKGLPANDEGLRKLTLSELKICELVHLGHSSKEIAVLLGISPETVQTHRKHIRRKLGVRGHDVQLAIHLRTTLES